MQIKNVNQNSSYPKTPSFGENIIYLADKSSFWRHVKQFPDSFEVGRISNKIWTLEEAAIKKPFAFTWEASNCVIPSIINSETKLTNLYHISPHEENIRNLGQIRKTLVKQALELKDGSAEKLEGFINAGNSSAMPGSPWNWKLLNTIMDIFKEISETIGMDYSVIAGRKNGSGYSSVISDAKTNTQSVYSRFNRKIIRNMDDIKEAYDELIFSPNHKINFEEIPQELDERLHSLFQDRRKKDILKGF